MYDDFIIIVFVAFAELSDTFLGEPKYCPKMDAAEIMTVAVVAARYFNNNLERALLVMCQTGRIPARRCLSVSRFNRQLHRYADFLEFCLQTLLELTMLGETFIIDSIPVPVCRRVRARRDELGINKVEILDRFKDKVYTYHRNMDGEIDDVFEEQYLEEEVDHHLHTTDTMEDILENMENNKE